MMFSLCNFSVSTQFLTEHKNLEKKLPQNTHTHTEDHNISWDFYPGVGPELQSIEKKNPTCW